jgi:hypothetical protein
MAYQGCRHSARDQRAVSIEVAVIGVATNAHQNPGPVTSGATFTIVSLSLWLLF